jgi:O-antigen ligase
VSRLEHASALEAFSKRATVLSLLTITAVQLVVHHDMTWTLRAAGAAAFCAGWIAARSGSQGLPALWILFAPIAPAALLYLSGRQGPVADVVWMAGLTGSILRMISWSRWGFAPLWSLLLGGWALALALVWPVLVLREAGFDLHALRDMTAINSWAMLPAPQVIAWTLYVVHAQLLGLFWFEWLHGRFTSAPERLPRIAHALWAGITVASVVAFVQGIDLGWLNPEFWAGRLRATGAMLDANAYGTAAAIAGPVGFLALRGSRRWMTVGGVLVLALNWAGVWVSGSRTALMCALFGAAGLAIGLWRARDDSAARKRAIGLFAAAVAVSLVVLSTAAIGPLQRIEDDDLSPSSLWHRGGYGTIAVRIVGEYPFTGVGAGAFRYLAPDYWRAMEDKQLEPDNAQNWWRHQMAELGILGGVLVLLWSFAIAWQVISARARATQVLPGWTARGLLAGIGACSLVGMPTQNPVVLLWFFFLVAWLLAITAPSATVSWATPIWIRRGWIAAVMLAVGYAGGELALARGSLDVSERARRFGRTHVEGAYALEEPPGAPVFRWTDDESRFILPVRSPSLIVRLWAQHPDVARLPVVVTIDGPCGPVFQQDLHSHQQVSVGIAIPPDVDLVDAVIRVSRTWRPADYDGDDTRTLGVGVITEFENDPNAAGAQDYGVKWGKCPASP